MIGRTPLTRMNLVVASTWLAMVSLLTTTLADEGHQVNDTPTTANESFSIKIVHRYSSTSSIAFDWIVPSRYDVGEYVIESRKRGSQSVTRSMPLPGNSHSYELTDLVYGADYNICVHATLSDTSERRNQCKRLFTIPLIRRDNLLILFGVIAYILLTFLLAYLCWRNAKKKFDAQLLDASSDDDEDETAERIYDTQNTPMLLGVPGGDKRPRSVIEEQEENMPFIDEEYHAGSNNVKWNWWFRVSVFPRSSTASGMHECATLAVQLMDSVWLRHSVKPHVDSTHPCHRG